MIKVDSREPEKIFRYLIKNKIEYEKLELPIGDFVFEEKDICIERKTVEDFISSLRSGHLHKQLLQMQSNFKHNFLIISGDIKTVFFSKIIQINIDNWIGSLVSTLIRFNVRMLQVDNDNQLILAIKKICSKVEDGKVITIKDTELLKNKLTTPDMMIKVLSCFDGIGIKKAEKILKEDNVIYDIVNLLVFEVEKKYKK
jgi:ERCC4-type nuclease